MNRLTLNPFRRLTAPTRSGEEDVRNAYGTEELGAKLDDADVEGGTNHPKISVESRKVGWKTRPPTRQIAGLVSREEPLSGV
ncbi:MAG: hypothetical protein WCD33_11125, partial [Mycobacterium sp.]